jgi:hypothetical protein
VVSFSVLGISAQVPPRPGDTVSEIWIGAECIHESYLENGIVKHRPCGSVVGQREKEKPRESYEKNGITMMLFGDESHAAVAISVNHILWPKVDRAIVRIVYETYFGEIPIVRVKESVVAAISGVLVMADPAPVSVEKVRSVQVTLVQEVSKTEFKIKK